MAGNQIPEEHNNGDENMGSNRRFGEIEELIDDLEKAFEKLPNFDVLTYAPSDHCFLHKNINRSRRSSLMEKMETEWEELKLCLAKSSIYARAYEERPDLMRAIIVAPEGTPYHHALFCFDIRFPSSYPVQPPELFYLSYNPSSNPSSSNSIIANLKGLLNLHMKSHSAPTTTLQFLTLIQNAFVVDKASETLRAGPSAQGPDMTVMKQTWEDMLCMLKSPPQDFQVFVQGYFRTRAHTILCNFKRCIPLDETTIGLFVRLIRAFEDNGTYCRHHYNKDYFDLLLLKEKLPQQKSSSFGILRKISTVFQGVPFKFSAGV